MRKFSVLTFLLVFGTFAFAAPSKLNLQNQFGETSINVVLGSVSPLVPGNSNIVALAGSTAPVDGTTGDNVAAKGSLYFAIDTGVMYQNIGTITAPVWIAVAGGANNGGSGVALRVAPGSSNIVSFAGSTAPVDGTTGDNFAAKGSLYFAIDTGIVYQNNGTLADPTWVALAGGANTTGAYSEATPSLTFDHSVGAKTVKVKKIGNLVSVTVPSATVADGAGTAVASTALAAGFRPAYAVTFPILVIDNGSTRTVGQVVIGTDGVLTLSVLGTGFTNAQAAGWDAFSISYSL